MWLLGAAFAADAVLDRVAAVVDEQVIALSEVYELGADFIAEECKSPFGQAACVHQAELEVLDALIQRALVRRELEKLKVDVTSEEVDQTIDSIVRDYGMADRNALREEVEKSGVRWDAYRQQVREQLQVQRFQQRVLAPRVNVLDEEVEDVYQRTARGERTPMVVLDAIGVVLPPEGEAQAAALEQTVALVAALNAGTEDWLTARDLYDGAGVSAALGTKPYKKGQLTPQLDAVVFDAPLGTFLEPIRVGNVAMVVRVISREVIEGDLVPFDEVAPAIKNQLFEAKLEDAESEWYQRARREAAVAVKLVAP